MKLVGELMPDERDKILEQLKLDKLKGAIALGIDQVERGS
jgi:hypothetical protein